MSVLLIGISVFTGAVGFGIAAIVRPALIMSPLAAFWRTPAGALRARLVTARTALGQILGAWGGYAVLALAGLGAVTITGWPFGGALFKLGQDSVDWPVYRWIETRRNTGEWADMMAIVTQLGDRPVTRWTAIVACVVLVFLAKERRWVPVVLVASVYVATFWTQLGLGDLVGRGHPPTNPGTYPSGSTMRILTQDGFAFFLIIQYARARGMRWAAGPRAAIAAGTIVVGAAIIQGYSRLDLMRHWVTDVIGGWYVGLCLLAVFIFAARIVLPTSAAAPAQTGPDERQPLVRDRA